MVTIFYIVIVAICVFGQTAILIKKFIEYYKEKQAQINVNVMIQNNQPVNNVINNIHWNHQICNNYLLLFLLLLILVSMLSQFVLRSKWNHWMLSSLKNLTFEEKAHLYDNIEFVLFTIGIPLIIYIKNEKIRKHVVDEIKDTCHICTKKCEF